MDVHVSIVAPDVPSDMLQAFTDDVCTAINRETAFTARRETAPSVLGSRGDPVTIGAIVLSVLTGTTASGLLDVLKAYVQRRSSIIIEVTRPDGKKVSLTAENLGHGQIEQTREALNALLLGEVIPGQAVRNSDRK
jgi:hypothetical protein